VKAVHHSVTINLGSYAQLRQETSCSDLLHF
jgi:hypothetical protein